MAIACEGCGKSIPKGYLICPSCRHKIGTVPVPKSPANPAVSNQSPVQTPFKPQPANLGHGSVTYAGFWIRFLASCVDSLILGAVYLSLYFFFLFSAGQLAEFLAAAFYAVVSLFYEGYFVSRGWYATPGKRALKLQVLDTHLQPVSFGVAMGRSFLKYVSLFTFGIGFIMAAFTTRKQALHDIMIRTVVIRT
jgi:uncharacterized RDD family membrane protein YckC